MRKIHALVIFGAAILSLYISKFFNELEIINFLNSLPTIIGILLATTLTSLAIILGMIGNNEMSIMKKYEKNKGKNYYKNIIKNLKWDVYFVFSAFIISSISRIILTKDSTLSIQLFDYVSVSIYKCLFVIEVSLLAASFVVINDLIQGLFNLNEMRYETASADTASLNIPKK